MGNEASSVRAAEKRISTGVAGLDEIMSGGLVRGRAYLVRGGPEGSWWGYRSAEDPSQFALPFTRKALVRMLRAVFRTQNELTLAVSGTGSAGMEAAVVNLIEPGDEMIVCVNGVFGTRMRDVAQRAGATVHAIEADWGQTIDPGAVAEALKAHPKTKVLKLDQERFDKWVKVGAQPSGTLQALINRTARAAKASAETAIERPRRLASSRTPASSGTASRCGVLSTPARG